jgi:hypothetical protein
MGVDDEAIADVASGHPLERRVDLLDRDQLDLGDQAVLCAEREQSWVSFIPPIDEPASRRLSTHGATLAAASRVRLTRFATTADVEA